MDELKDNQERALYSFFKFKKHIYYSAPTGHGKSLIFQSIPLIADVLADNAVGTSNILVISPLLSLMHDQINDVNTQTELSAAGIFKGQAESVLAVIEDGTYSIFYTSPESILPSSRRRRILSGSRFADCCIGIVIDEAHCIRQWSQSIASKSAFRKWFDMIGEVRSLLPKVVQMAVFCNQTANKATKQSITDVSKSGSFYLENVCYGAGREAVQRQDRECKKKECGRAGRDGTVSHSCLLYNGFTLLNSEKDMKDFVFANVCRRALLLSSFPKSSGNIFQRGPENAGCKCFDICAKACMCQSDDCSRNTFDFLTAKDNNANTEMAKKRSVTDEERDLVESKMLEYKKSLQHAIVPNLKIVSYPNVLFLFTDFQVRQVFEDINEPLSGSAIKASLLDDTDNREERSLVLDGDWLEIQVDSEINISDSINLSEIEEDASVFHDSLDNLCKSLDN
eukprot:gene15002-6156_t